MRSWAPQEPAPSLRRSISSDASLPHRGETAKKRGSEADSGWLRRSQTSQDGVESYACGMTTILFVADRQSVIDRVHAALSTPDLTVVDHDDPDTAAAAAVEQSVDRVLVDMQVGAMGAMAVTRAVRAASGEDPIPVTILLDREADAFLARRSGASNWLSKDAAAVDLRTAVIGAGTPA